MVVLLGNPLLDLVLLVFTLTVLSVMYVRHRYRYWERKKVAYLTPKFPLGNNRTLLPRGISQGTITKTFYDEFRKMGHKVGGVFLGLQPQLLILDPEYIKDVLTRDFQNFVDRGIYMNENEPISVNIFTQPGAQWRNARVKFSAAFSSAKLKIMFQTVVECSKSLEGVVEKFSRDKTDVDILEVMGCFSTDVIGSCVFGISCNSFKNPDAEFRKMGRKVFEEFNLSDQLNLFLSIYAQNLAKKIGVRNVQKDVSKFFFQSIKETVEYREKHNIHRKDFLELLIEMKNSDVKLSMNELTAQAFLFFIAGFETSSTTVTMTLYEMSQNQDLQSKVRQDVLEVLGRNNGEITYDSVGQMKYLGQAVDETLRLWPPVVTLNRVCTEDYKFYDSKVSVEKGIPILISTLGLHHDPEYWPDPLTWNPDRFSDENRDNRRPFTYLPFGDGPRNCLGLRFGLMQTKAALATILKDHRVTLSPKTITPLDLDPDSFLLSTINKVYLNFEKIHRN